MGAARDVSDEEKTTIRTLAMAGLSLRPIAEATSHSRSTCQRVVQLPAKAKRPNRRGSPKKIDERVKRSSIRSVSSGKMSAAKVKDELQLKRSLSTVQRTIRSVDWLKYKKRSVTQLLTARHKEVRVQWASTMALMDDNEWRKVVFSDEKKWNLDGPDGMRYNWIDIRREEEVNKRRHSGGGSVIVWGAICGNKTSELKILVDKQDSIKYVVTLQPYLQPLIVSEMQIIQQDNAPCHTSGYTMGWLSSQNISVMVWPVMSPDLNPIGNLWGILTQAVYVGGKQYDSAEELKRSILKAWKQIGTKDLEPLVLSMRKRCIEVLKCQGNHIMY